MASELNTSSHKAAQQEEKKGHKNKKGESWSDRKKRKAPKPGTKSWQAAQKLPSADLSCGPLDVLPGEFKQLEEDGYQVILGVLSKEECENSIAQLKHILETSIRTKRPAFRFDDWKTWGGSVKLPHLDGPRDGMYQQYVGHLQPIWDIRQHPRVVKIFQTMWGDEDLCVSFDGLSLLPPGSFTGQRPQEDEHWWHFDQGRAKRGRHCVQGFITLRDQSTQDATLRVMKKSNKIHGAFMDRYAGMGMSDWVRPNIKTEEGKEQMQWIQSQDGVEPVRVEATAGSLVLWDSQTLHCGSKQLEKDANWRFVVYVSMRPRRLFTPDVLQLRKNDWSKRTEEYPWERCTNHWGDHAFARTPSTRMSKAKRDPLRQNPPTFPEPKLTPLGLSLV